MSSCLAKIVYKADADLSNVYFTIESLITDHCDIANLTVTHNKIVYILQINDKNFNYIHQ